ncbi:hypothetical protein MNAN1_001746 [Malassezia nana]|uniref:DNA-directed RNA polymerase III subunit RPC5 n=1 Tax=Malassezia nana TaxID=180528 RepID=A0AAF0ELI7_9BASI|nr:hypothetical protein MNAN1_001746 [Malassezia nana]
MATARDDPDGAPAVSLPVYLSASVAPHARLELFQYPLYARGRPLPVPATAAQRGQTVTARWRPHSDRVEMELPIDMREAVYNQERGAMFGESSASMGRIGVPGAEAVKQERGAETPLRFDCLRLESSMVPRTTQYMIGTMQNGELHLSPLHAVQQMRPSMQHVDCHAQANEQGRRVTASDDESDAQRDGRRHVVPLNVSLRPDAGGARAGRAAAPGAPTQRDAEAERWVDLRFADASRDEQAQASLQARQRDTLVCTTPARDFL